MPHSKNIIGGEGRELRKEPLAGFGLRLFLANVPLKGNETSEMVLLLAQVKQETVVITIFKTLVYHHNILDCIVVLNGWTMF